LGEGVSWDLSAKKALAMISSPPTIVIYPTGAGTPQRLERANIENYGLRGWWFPDGDSVLFWANEPGHAPRYYVQSVAGGAPHAVTPEGTREGMLAGNGKFMIAQSTDNSWSIYPLDGAASRPVSVLEPGDKLVTTTADGRAVYAYHISTIPARVERVDLEGGRRTLYKEFAPVNRAGLKEVIPWYISDDEQTYTYWTWVHLSTLFTVSWK
jgi:hypothetical protein